MLIPSLSATIPERPQDARTGAKGHLVIVGGGTTTDTIVARTFELAGGKHARLLIVPQASAELDAGSSSLEFWQSKGATNAGVLDLADRALARQAIESANIIWMPGGSQSRLMNALTEAGVIETIVARFHAGAVIGGTSAGAAATSGSMILGGARADETSIKSQATELGPGLGLLPNAIVDQHFIARRRFNRLLAAVLDQPKMIGVGIDERTALVISPDGWEVAGDGQVVIIDARAAKVEEAAAGAMHAARDIRTHVLRAGHRFEPSKLAE